MGKVALITGAGKETGLGFEVARQLAALGIAVVITARDPAAAQARAAEVSQEGGQALGMSLDVTIPAARKEIVARLEAEFGRLDILINNAAGIASYGESASTADLAGTRSMFDTVLFGSWALLQDLLPLLERSESPRIVNVSSGAGSHGDPVFGLTSGNAMGPSYATAKAALNALTAAWARELPATFRMNAVCPGFTATFPGGAEMGARPVSEGAKGIVWAATLPDDGPTGGLFRDERPLPW